MDEYKNRGTLLERYNIYVANCGEQYPKSFDEWLNS